MGDGGAIRFRGRIRWWDETKGSGLAVVDVPNELVATLGGRRQYRISGSMGGAAFSGSGMLVGGGGYCVAVSKAALRAAGVAVGDEAELAIARA